MVTRAERPPVAAGRSLTRRGWWFLVGGVLFGVGAFVLRERDLLVIAGVGVAVPLLAWLYTGVRRTRVEADHRVLPVRLQAGEDGRLVLRLTNVDSPGSRPTRPLDVRQPGVVGLMPGASAVVDPILPGEAAELLVPFRAGRRGSYTVPAPLLRLLDPFALVQVRRTLPAGAEVLVLPTVFPLSGLPRGTSGRGSSSGSASATAGGGDPDAGVRAYRLGDDIRTVHWRASARLEEELVVRVAGAATLGSAVLLLDHRTHAHDEDSLEVAVTLAASIGHHLHEQEVDLVVTDHTGLELVAGHDVDDALLVTLAAAGSDEHAFHPSVPGNPDAVVAVVGRLTAAEVTALAPLRRGRTSAIALVLDDGDGDGDGAATRRAAGAEPLTASVVAAALAEAGWRAVVVDVLDAGTRDGGTHLAQVWRGACGPSAARGPIAAVAR